MLLFSPMSDDAVMALRTSLRELGADGVVSASLRRALKGRSPIQGAFPHAFYDLGRQDLLTPNRWGSKRISQRCLLVHEKKTLLIAEVHDPQLAVAFHDGRLVKSIPAAIRRTERQLPIDGDSFSVNVVRLRADHVVALWLTSGNTGDARLVPVAPTPAGLTTGKILTPLELYHLLQSTSSSSVGRAADVSVTTYP